jgi:AMMECR1 domain-containing protein
MFEPNSVYAKIAYDAVLLYVKANTKLEKRESEIPEALKLKLGCKVSIYDSNGNLKGSYGTTKPKTDYLFHEIIENAINAAKEGTNNKPLSENELNDIVIHVDVLSRPKDVENLDYLKPHKHGLIIETEDGKSSVLFPNQDGIETPEEMIQTAKEKAGIEQEKEGNYKLKHFTSTKYK